MIYKFLFYTLVWIIIGFWLLYKNNWYEEEENYENMINLQISTVLFAPFAFVIFFFKQFVIRKW